MMYAYESILVVRMKELKLMNILKNAFKGSVYIVCYNIILPEIKHENSIEKNVR